MFQNPKPFWESGYPAFDLNRLEKCYILRVNIYGYPEAAFYHDGAWVVEPFRQLRNNKYVAVFVPVNNPLVKTLCNYHNIRPCLPTKKYKIFLEENNKS